MAKTPTTGRPSLYRGKLRGKSVRAYLNADGWKRFGKARAALAKAHPEQSSISEGDVVQHLLEHQA